MICGMGSCFIVLFVLLFYSQCQISILKIQDPASVLNLNKEMSSIVGAMLHL